MSAARGRRRTLRAATATGLVAAFAAVAPMASAAGSIAASAASAASVVHAADDDPAAPSPWWILPLAGARVVRGFEAPAHEYGPGHRGIDLGVAARGEPAAVRSPADGVIVFAGPVAGRGVVTIDHGGGLVTTLEPVDLPADAGTVVVRGDVVGSLGHGGHAPELALHFGVRRDGEYIDPLLLVGGIPRAVLLPCC